MSEKPTPTASRECAASCIKTALVLTALSIKSGDLDDHSLELIDQAEAIMQMVLDNLQKQPLPPEFGYHMANAVNELEACQKLCSGKLHKAVFDVSVAVERIRDEAQS